MSAILWAMIDSKLKKGEAVTVNTFDLAQSVDEALPQNMADRVHVYNALKYSKQQLGEAWDNVDLVVLLFSDSSKTKFNKGLFLVGKKSLASTTTNKKQWRNSLMVYGSLSRGFGGWTFTGPNRFKKNALAHKQAIVNALTEADSQGLKANSIEELQRMRAEAGM